jgi:hypothetical protein
MSWILSFGVWTIVAFLDVSGSDHCALLADVELDQGRNGTSPER